MSLLTPDLLWLCPDSKLSRPDPTYNLQRLALACGLPLDEARTELLLAITEFNLEARYPDLKRSFRVRCTRDYALAQIARIEETLAWLRSHLM